MWGLSSNYPNIRSYAEAAREYRDTKPLRGKPDFRPLDARSSRAKSNIRKEGDDFVIQLYRTDIIRYKPDGTIILNHGGWVTPSTAGAISAMSPFTSWCSKGYLVVSTSRRTSYADGNNRFVVPREGLEFNPQGVPKNPPAAMLRKKRVKKDEAKKVRALFKDVPKYIKTFCALYEDGQPEQVARLHVRDFVGFAELSDETAAQLALNYLEYDWDYTIDQAAGIYHGFSVANAKRSVAAFWSGVYKVFQVHETYEVELPYGEVP